MTFNHEEALVACALDDPRVIEDAVEALPRHFANTRLSAAWQAITDLHADNESVTTTAVARLMGKDKAVAAMLGDLRTLIANDVAHPKRIRQYAESVVDRALNRSIQVVLATLLDETRDPFATAREALLEARAALDGIEQPEVLRVGGRYLLHKLEAQCRRFEGTDPADRVPPAVMTGFEDIDRVTGGLRRGQLHILGGDTSSGKSSLANAIIHNVLCNHGTVDVFGYEDEPLALAARIAARHSHLSNFHLQQGDLNGADLEETVADWDALAMTFDLEVCHERPSSITELCLQIREGVRRRGTDLIVIDYVQLLKTIGEGRSAYERLSNISKALWSTARRTNAALLLLSQLRRRDSKRPEKTDIKDCGDLEQEAYTVMLLWNRRLSLRNEEVIPVVELLVDKNKNGPCVDSWLHFDTRSTTFRNLEPYATARGDYGIARKNAHATR